MARRRRSVGVLELLANGPSDHFVQKAVVWPNFAGVMPQSVAVWAQQAGARVHYDVYTGRENPFGLLSRGLDVLFISAFTRASFLAYAVAQRARAQGVTVVLGGPHARSFPEHAARYVDYVCHFTDRALVESLLDAGPSRPGKVVDAGRHPAALPSLRERAELADQALARALPIFRGLPMIGSLGCPYTCSFCVDATVDYQPLPFEELEEDLRFIERRYGPGTFALWHDPNFAVRFHDYMELIARSGTKLRHIAETSLSLLKEANLARMSRLGFVQLLPGVESWSAFHDKSSIRRDAAPAAKVRRVADHFTLIERYVPGVQANFILGLDDAEGDEPWSLTKRFVDETSPAIFPGYFLLTDFRNAPASAELARDGRALATPFPLLDNLTAMNVRPRHYEALEFFERVVDLLEHTFSRDRLIRRFKANRHLAMKLVNLGRGLTEGQRLIERRRAFVARMRQEPDVRAFMNAERREPPRLFFDEVVQGLGPFAAAVPRELLHPDSWLRTLASTGVTARAA